MVFQCPELELEDDDVDDDVMIDDFHDGGDEVEYDDDRKVVPAG